MKLRQRIVLALVAIAVVLIAPTIYGLSALRTLEGIAQTLRTRDAVGALALGRLQTSFGEVEHWEGVYLAVQAPGSREQVEQSALLEQDGHLLAVRRRPEMQIDHRGFPFA